MVSSMTLYILMVVVLVSPAGAIGIQDQIWVQDWMVSQVRSAAIFPCNHVRAHLLPQEREWPDSGPDKAQ